MRVAVAQVDATVGDLSGNAALVRDGIAAARGAGASLVLFPEMVISGYPPEDLLFKQHFVRDCEEIAGELAEEVEDILVILGCPLLEGGLVFNGALVLGGGNVLARYRKIWLPNYAVFDERRYFAPGDRVLVVRAGDVRVGVNVCEDIWQPRGPSEEAALRGGAQIIANISMSPYHFGKGQDRTAMLAARARDCGAFIVYANGVGGQDELIFDGHSLVFAPDGSLLARGRQFAEDLFVMDLEVKEAEAAQGTGVAPTVWPLEEVPLPAEVWGGSRGTPPESSPPGDTGGTSVVRRISGPPRASLEPLAELYAALVLGVRDYVSKNGFNRVVLGLSGGIDSALTLCVAVDALGADRVAAVSMPSRYTSTGTRSDARIIAERTGVEFMELPIEGVFTAYLEALEDPFAGLEANVAEENLQARIRGNLLMALSNKFGWLVLTTGNKSETAVGYATLYGDMAGGFAVIKDVPKTMVYRLAEYRNSLADGADGTEPPIPESVLRRPPSAELAEGQTDQDSLPPYDVLDQIIEDYVVHDRSIEEIVAGGLPLPVVERVAALIDRNEYKRRQGPPGPRLTSKSFGKDRRLPITNRYRG